MYVEYEYNVLLFSALGCHNVSPPENAWAKRDGDNLVIRCNQTGETWYLTCKDDEWIGEFKNCSGKETVESVEEMHFLQKGRVSS